MLRESDCAIAQGPRGDTEPPGRPASVATFRRPSHALKVAVVHYWSLAVLPIRAIAIDAREHGSRRGRIHMEKNCFNGGLIFSMRHRGASLELFVALILFRTLCEFAEVDLTASSREPPGLENAFGVGIAARSLRPIRENALLACVCAYRFPNSL
jgi:hypothetical protein